MTLEEQIRHVRELREEKDRTRKEADKAKAAYDKAHMALWDRMDGSGVGSVKIDGTSYVKVSPTIYGTVNDKSVFAEWAEEHAPHLIAPAPLEGRINEYVRQCIDNNEELPPGLTWYTKQHVSQRKA